jgi:hypothetical protein
MQLPLHILQVGEDRVPRRVRTRDISTGGVCFFSDDRVDVGGRIEYLITLSDANPPVRIRCLGKVLRSSRLDEPATENFEIAVTMERYQFVRPEEVSDSSLVAV